MDKLVNKNYSLERLHKNTVYATCLFKLISAGYVWSLTLLAMPEANHNFIFLKHRRLSRMGLAQGVFL